MQDEASDEAGGEDGEGYVDAAAAVSDCPPRASACVDTILHLRQIDDTPAGRDGHRRVHHRFLYDRAPPRLAKIDAARRPTDLSAVTLPTPSCVVVAACRAAGVRGGRGDVRRSSHNEREFHGHGEPRDCSVYAQARRRSSTSSRPTQSTSLPTPPTTTSVWLTWCGHLRGPGRALVPAGCRGWGSSGRGRGIAAGKKKQKRPPVRGRYSQVELTRCASVSVSSIQSVPCFGRVLCASLKEPPPKVSPVAPMPLTESQSVRAMRVESLVVVMIARRRNCRVPTSSASRRRRPRKMPERRRCAHARSVAAAASACCARRTPSGSVVRADTEARSLAERIRRLAPLEIFRASSESRRRAGASLTDDRICEASAILGHPGASEDAHRWQALRLLLTRDQGAAREHAAARPEDSRSKRNVRIVRRKRARRRRAICPTPHRLWRICRQGRPPRAPPRPSSRLLPDKQSFDVLYRQRPARAGLRIGMRYLDRRKGRGTPGFACVTSSSARSRSTGSRGGTRPQRNSPSR